MNCVNFHLKCKHTNRLYHGCANYRTFARYGVFNLKEAINKTVYKGIFKETQKILFYTKF